MVNAMAAQRTEDAVEGLLAVGGCVTIVFGIVFLLVTSFAVLHLLLAFSLRRRRHYQLCLIAAGVTTMQMPFGAALGIATFIVLLRPTVPPLFGQVVPRPAPLSARYP
jgi:predicted Co/Zn/Cd cation transporter (cation efflux family)